MGESEIKTLANFSKVFNKCTESQKEYIKGFADGMAFLTDEKESDLNAKSEDK